jgi:hypothetical protein
MPLSKGTPWSVSMDEEVQRRLAANEVIFREVNEGIERGQWPGEPDSQVGFRCECARLGCNMLLNLTLAEYEHVRSDPRRFVMIRGHQVPSVERVVEEMADYVIVEKRDEAGERAEDSDPRS